MMEEKRGKIGNFKYIFCVYLLAGLHVDILLKRIEIEKSQNLIPGVVGPIGSKNFLLHRTGISKIDKRLK